MSEFDRAVRELLTAVVPAPPPDAHRDWADVLERAGVSRAAPGQPRGTAALRRAAAEFGRRRGPRRSRAALAAAAAVVLVFAGTAYALAREFLIGEPAPAEVREQAALLNEVKGELIPRVHQRPRIRVEETRLAASVVASTGPVYLWVAPTESGGYCLFQQIVGTELPQGRPNLRGGCGRRNDTIDSALSVTRVRPGHLLTLAYGRVDRRVERLEAEVSGRIRTVPVTDGYFLFELPRASDGGLSGVELIGYDGSGREVARRRHSVPFEFFRPRPSVDVSRERPLLEIETRVTKQPIRLYVVERDGERCTVLVSPGGTGSGCGRRRPDPHEIDVAPTQIGSASTGMLLLWGEVGSEIRALELRFEDGRVERLPLAGHYTLYQVDRADFAAGRRPIVLIGRSDDGDVVSEKRLGPWRR